MKKFLIFCIAVLTFHGLSGQNDEWKNLLSKESYSDSLGTLPYRLYIPAQILPDQKPAFVLFLHGAGERGTDNELQLTHGVKEFMAEDIRGEYNFILLAPQCPESARWTEVDWTKASSKMPPRISIPLQESFELMDSLIEEYNVDPQQIYITGLSMGGFGTWDAICRRPDFFAAAMPVCGGGDESKAGLIAHIPIRAFHGKLDHLVLPARSINMVNAIRLNGGNAEIILFDDLGHLCWDRVYQNHDNIHWLFSNWKTGY
ncbi:MAG: prolyl oligopeptidase family serine peptidase [Bacteroidales bacterium]|nr:prolyl oligopeptidase family serine peptidase [Bacteroidales bacterium]